MHYPFNYEMEWRKEHARNSAMYMIDRDWITHSFDFHPFGAKKRLSFFSFHVNLRNENNSAHWATSNTMNMCIFDSATIISYLLLPLSWILNEPMKLKSNQFAWMILKTFQSLLARYVSATRCEKMLIWWVLVCLN